MARHIAASGSDNATLSVIPYNLSGDWTMACWVKFDSFTAANDRFFVYGTVGLNGIGFNANNSGQVFINYLGVGSWGSVAISANTWHHLAVCGTHTPSISCTFYVDGSSVATNTTQTPANATGTVQAQYDHPCSAKALAELYVANFYLTAAEITQVFRGQCIFKFRNPKQCQFYAPLEGVLSPEPELSGQSVRSLTITGTTQVGGPAFAHSYANIFLTPTATPPPAGSTTSGAAGVQAQAAVVASNLRASTVGVGALASVVASNLKSAVVGVAPHAVATVTNNPKAAAVGVAPHAVAKVLTNLKAATTHAAAQAAVIASNLKAAAAHVGSLAAAKAQTNLYAAAAHVAPHGVGSSGFIALGGVSVAPHALAKASNLYAAAVHMAPHGVAAIASQPASAHATISPHSAQGISEIETAHAGIAPHSAQGTSQIETAHAGIAPHSAQGISEIETAHAGVAAVSTSQKASEVRAAAVGIQSAAAGSAASLVAAGAGLHVVATPSQTGYLVSAGASVAPHALAKVLAAVTTGAARVREALTTVTVPHNVYSLAGCHLAVHATGLVAGEVVSAHAGVKGQATTVKVVANPLYATVGVRARGLPLSMGNRVFNRVGVAAKATTLTTTTAVGALQVWGIDLTQIEVAGYNVDPQVWGQDTTQVNVAGYNPTIAGGHGP